MSRIRSIHPGLWSDEHFVLMSPLARLFFIGLWNECDDHGVFQWAPVQLKIRLLPLEGADPVRLLTEMVEAGFVVIFEIAGKRYGAVKNFVVFQRPKKPRYIFPITADIARFVGMDENQFPTSGEQGGDLFGTSGEAVSLGGEGRGEERRGRGEDGTRARRGKVAVPLPDDFEPALTPKAKENWDRLKNPEGELERFKDHAISKGRKAVDWQAAFRTWLSKAVEFEQERADGRTGRSAWLQR